VLGLLVIATGAMLPSIPSGAQTVLPLSDSQSPTNAEEAKIAYGIERGMPYSGTWITRHTTTLPDGQIKKDDNLRKVWRDSDGRTRDETTWTRFNGVVATVCRIEDPVAKVRYIWRTEPGRRTVVTETRFTMDKYAVTEIWPNPPSRPVESTPGATIVILRPGRQMNPGTRGEKLGPKYLNGVYAEGVRMVDPICTGADECKSGRTHNHISEIWNAPDLNLVIRMYLDDGLGFTEDSELKDIDRSEPDPTMFQPPSDLPRRQAPDSDPAWHESYGAD
jgi:hypothetical protein